VAPGFEVDAEQPGELRRSRAGMRRSRRRSPSRPTRLQTPVR
jgi:hypothetical protein